MENRWYHKYSKLAYGSCRLLFLLCLCLSLLAGCGDGGGGGGDDDDDTYVITYDASGTWTVVKALHSTTIIDHDCDFQAVEQGTYTITQNGANVTIATNLGETYQGTVNNNTYSITSSSVVGNEIEEVTFTLSLTSETAYSGTYQIEITDDTSECRVSYSIFGFKFESPDYDATGIWNYDSQFSSQNTNADVCDDLPVVSSQLDIQQNGSSVTLTEGKDVYAGTSGGTSYSFSKSALIDGRTQTDIIYLILSSESSFTGKIIRGIGDAHDFCVTVNSMNGSSP